MILRAILWVALVSAIAPQEPMVLPPGVGGFSPYLGGSDGASTGGVSFRNPSDNLPLISEWRNRIRESIPRLRAEIEQYRKDHPTRGIL